MNDVDRHDASSRTRWCCGVAVGALLLLPGVAQAQSYSPGDLVVTPPPSLNDGRAGSTIFGAAQSQAQTRNAPGPATANPPDFQYTAFADLSGRYTTNALGSARDSPDFDSRAALTFNATEQSLRVNAALNYNGAVDYFVNNSGGTIFTNNLNASALVDVLPDHFTFAADLFATPQYASQLGNIAPSGETLPAGANSDVRNSYGFSASPDLYFRLGDFLRSDSQPSYSEVFYDAPVGARVSPLGKVASNIETGAFTQRITSGDDFTRLQWAAVANYTQMSHSAGGLTQRSATGELSYALTHGISLVADGGYQTVKADVALSKVLSGPIFFGGLKFDTPRITGDFRIGEQYRALSVTGHLTYQLTPALSLSAAAIDDVTTPGAGIFSPGSLLSSLGSAISSGQIQIPASGVLNLNGTDLAGIGLQNTPSRIQTQSVSLQYSLDRLTAQITASATNQANVAGTLPGKNNSLRSMAISPSLTYTFSEDWSATAFFTYSDQKLAIGRSTLAEFNARTNYTISDKTQIYLEGDYLERNSNAALAAFSSSSGDVSITSIRVGLRRQL